MNVRLHELLVTIPHAVIQHPFDSYSRGIRNGDLGLSSDGFSLLHGESAKRQNGPTGGLNPGPPDIMLCYKRSCNEYKTDALTTAPLVHIHESVNSLAVGGSLRSDGIILAAVRDDSREGLHPMACSGRSDSDHQRAAAWFGRKFTLRLMPQMWRHAIPQDRPSFPIALLS